MLEIACHLDAEGLAFGQDEKALVGVCNLDDGIHQLFEKVSQIVALHEPCGELVNLLVGVDVCHRCGGFALDGSLLVEQ